MSRPERLLDLDRPLGGQPLGRCRRGASEGHAVVVDLAEVGQAEDLEAAGVGQDRPVPAHEPVQPTQTGDALVAGSQGEVVGVGQDDLDAGRAEVSGRSALTVAWVPTGMNCGVSITPCGVVSEPSRARPTPAAREVKATGADMAAAYAMNIASPKLKNRYPSASAVR